MLDQNAETGGWIVRLRWAPGHESLHGLFQSEAVADWWGENSNEAHLAEGYEVEFMNVDSGVWMADPMIELPEKGKGG